MIFKLYVSLSPPLNIRMNSLTEIEEKCHKTDKKIDTMSSL